MNAYELGFIKRAQEYGLSEGQAIDLLKSAQAPSKVMGKFGPTHDSTQYISKSKNWRDGIKKELQSKGYKINGEDVYGDLILHKNKKHHKWDHETSEIREFTNYADIKKHVTLRKPS